MIRRAGCFILDSKSNTVSGKTRSGRLATNWYTLGENVIFWLSSIRSNFDFNLFPGMVKHNEKDELGPETVYRLWLGSKFERRWSQFFEKNEKSEKSYFLNFSSIFEINRCKNWLFSNNFWVQVTRRAGCLILDSKSNTVLGKSSSRGYATNFDLLSWNVNFSVCSIR